MSLPLRATAEQLEAVTVGTCPVDGKDGKDERHFSDVGTINSSEPRGRLGLGMQRRLSGKVRWAAQHRTSAENAYFYRLFANSNIAVTPKVTPHSARDSGRLASRTPKAQLARLFTSRR